MAAYLPPNLRTDALFIIRSSSRQAYIRCRCRAEKKNAFWIGRGGTDWFNWALARNGIYFRDAKKSKDHDYIGVLNFFDFATSKTTTVSTLDQPGGLGLAVSADGRSLLYDDKGDAESSIMLVKNFR